MQELDENDNGSLDWKIQSKNPDLKGNATSVNRSVKGSVGCDSSASDMTTMKKRNS